MGNKLALPITENNVQYKSTLYGFETVICIIVNSSIIDYRMYYRYRKLYYSALQFSSNTIQIFITFILCRELKSND